MSLPSAPAHRSEAIAELDAALREAAAVDLGELAAGVSDDGWAMADDALRFAAALVRRRRPRHVVEFGAGRSTQVLADACRRLDPPGRVTSVENDPEMARRTQRALADRELDDVARVHVAPLVLRRRLGRLAPRYLVWSGAFAAHGPVDLALVDGPPGLLGGREGAVYQALELGREGTVVLPDDAARAQEAEFVPRIGAALGDAVEISDLPGFARGLAAVVLRRELGRLPDDLEDWSGQ